MTLRWFSVVLVAVMLAVGACSDDDSGDALESVDLPEGAATVLDAYREATAVQHDGDAMLALVTEGYEFLSVGALLDRDAYAAEVNGYFDTFTVESLGERLVVGGEGTYVVSEPQHISAGTSFDSEGFSVTRVVEVDGTWLVDSHRFTGD